MPASRPLFVTLEGIEGCGKTTQISRLAAFLTRSGVAHKVTREPGGTPAGEEIRRILLTPRDPGLTPMADLLLYGAARAQHLDQIIEPALAAGRTVKRVRPVELGPIATVDCNLVDARFVGDSVVFGSLGQGHILRPMKD